MKMKASQGNWWISSQPKNEVKLRLPPRPKKRLYFQYTAVIRVLGLFSPLFLYNGYRPVIFYTVVVVVLFYYSVFHLQWSCCWWIEWCCKLNRTKNRNILTISEPSHETCLSTWNERFIHFVGNVGIWKLAVFFFLFIEE